MISNNYYNKTLKAKESSEIPEWLRTTKEYVELIKMSEGNQTSEHNGFHTHLAVSSGLLMLLMERIKELDANPKSQIIRFPNLFRRLCTSFQIRKEYVWQLLYCLRDLGCLEIVRFQGVRIKNSKKLTEALLK